MANDDLTIGDDIRNHDPIDPDLVAWDITSMDGVLPAGTVQYAAGMLRDLSGGLRLIDLLYSALENDYYRQQRMECLGIISVAADESEEYKAAIEQLCVLNRLSLPFDVDVNVIEGTENATGQTVYGIIALYVEDGEEAANGTN